MWIIFSLLTALSLATSDALTKKALASRDEYFVAWARLLFALPFFLLCMFFIEVPSLDTTFWIATFCALPLEIAAIILYTRALKVSPISLSMPFLALTPVFLIITSNVILGEKISINGGIGIFLVAIGSYTLNIHKIRKSLLEPVKAIFKERGSVLMIIVAFIFSITSSLGKMAIEHSSPLFFGSFYFILVTILFTPIAVVKNRSRIRFEKKDVFILSSIGITYSMMVFFHMIAIDLVNVAYMISIKRTSLLFSIFYGFLLFNEKNINEKAIGGTIMLGGFVLIVLAG